MRGREVKEWRKRNKLTQVGLSMAMDVSYKCVNENEGAPSVSARFEKRFRAVRMDGFVKDLESMIKEMRKCL